MCHQHGAAMARQRIYQQQRSGSILLLRKGLSAKSTYCRPVSSTPQPYIPLSSTTQPREAQSKTPQLKLRNHMDRDVVGRWDNISTPSWKLTGRDETIISNPINKQTDESSYFSVESKLDFATVPEPLPKFGPAEEVIIALVHVSVNVFPAFVCRPTRNLQSKNRGRLKCIILISHVVSSAALAW